MSEPLTGQQEEHAREIAKQEVASFARLLGAELEASDYGFVGEANDIPTVLRCVGQALCRFNEGEVVL